MKPFLYILGCGGTIAGCGESEDSLLGYAAGEIGIDELIRAVPQMTEQCDVQGEQFCNIDSSDMTEELWLRLSRRVQELADTPSVDGIIITHGTDTMDETAYFLNLTVHAKKPIVLVGAMRPATAISADGPLNLLDAVSLAASPKSGLYGVLQVMNGTICGARNVEKTDTTHVDTFSQGRLGCLGIMQDGVPLLYQQPLRRHTFSSSLKCPEGALPRVDILYCYVGMDGRVVEDAVEKGTMGIVLAGLGHGNIPSYIMPMVQTAMERYIPVIRSRRAADGAVTTSKDWPGMIGADTLSPQKAKILLQLLIANGVEKKQIGRYFGEY